MWMEWEEGAGGARGQWLQWMMDDRWSRTAAETQDGRPVLPGPQEGAVGRPASIIESRESLEGGNPFV